MNVCIGQVTHYYNRIGVAVLDLTDRVRLGDRLHICGHTTDFYQVVSSLQINHRPVEEAAPGDDVALKVAARVRPGDEIFKLDVEDHFEPYWEPDDLTVV
ncbi:MAG TPA: hypothetical protein VK879_17010 [Candidatus Sulfomarinibacteraceae bacterium]|nr:hypothetical protein [Candidatus Sulfomarinibacteraceae bacterium]